MDTKINTFRTTGKMYLQKNYVAITISKDIEPYLEIRNKDKLLITLDKETQTLTVKKL